MKPDFAIINERKKDGWTVLCVDTARAVYQGIKWAQLGDFGKRKFENLLVITRGRERIKVTYV